MPLRALPDAKTHVVLAQEGEDPVSANQLKSAIDDIKRRLAEQQQGRESTGTGELTAELRSARETISELTASMNRLRDERDRLMAGLNAVGGELRLRGDELAAREREIEATRQQADAEIRALQEALEDRIGAHDSALADIESLRVDLTRAEREIASLTDTVDRAWTDRAALQGALEEAQAAARREMAAAESGISERDAQVQSLGDRLKATTDDYDRASAAADELAIQLEIMTRAAYAVEQELSDSVAAVELSQDRLEQQRQQTAKIEEQLAEARERTRQVALAAEGRLEERTETLTGRIRTAEQRIDELETEMASLREVATISVAEVEAIGEQLLVTLQENEELVNALGEVRASRSMIEEELTAARRDVDLYSARAGLSGTSGADSSLLAEAEARIQELSEELIKRDRQLADDAADGDVEAMTVQLANLQRELDLTIESKQVLEAELASLKGIQVASLNGDAILGLLDELNAVETGNGWVMTVPAGIEFAPGSDELASAAFDPLGKVATMLTHFSDAPVRIVGHTDSYGDADVNRVLSLARAESVRNYLVETYGLRAERMAVEGYGEEQPIASNQTSNGRRANRRVEVYVRTEDN